MFHFDLFSHSHQTFEIEIRFETVSHAENVVRYGSHLEVHVCSSSFDHCQVHMSCSVVSQTHYSVRDVTVICHCFPIETPLSTKNGRRDRLPLLQQSSFGLIGDFCVRAAKQQLDETPSTFSSTGSINYTDLIASDASASGSFGPATVSSFAWCAKRCRVDMLHICDPATVALCRRFAGAWQSVVYTGSGARSPVLSPLPMGMPQP